MGVMYSGAHLEWIRYTGGISPAYTPETWSDPDNTNETRLH